MKPKSFFNKLNLSVLPENVATYIRESVIEDTDVDFLTEDNEAFIRVRELIEKKYPSAILKEKKEESEKPKREPVTEPTPTETTKVGEKYKPGDFVFGHIYKDPNEKTPFIVNYWSHDAYYVSGDGHHYVKEENLTPATEADFDSFYGDKAESYKSEFKKPEPPVAPTPQKLTKKVYTHKIKDMKVLLSLTTDEDKKAKIKQLIDGYKVLKGMATE